MSQVGAVLQAKRRMAFHQIASVRDESLLKVAVLTVSGFLLWFGAYYLFYKGFGFLMDFGTGSREEFNFGDLLMSRLLSILSLALFFLLIFSNVLVAFSTMYKSKEVIYLLQGPITYQQFFHARFVECVTFSSWSLAFLGSPLMLAYGVQTEASWTFYLATIVFFVPYVVIPACAGALITMILVRVFPRLKTRVMIALAALGVGCFFLYIARIIRRTEVSEDTLLPAFLNASTGMQSPLLPSTWASNGVLAAANYDLSRAVFLFLLLAANALMALLVTGLLAEKLFYPGWSYLMGQDRQRFKPLDKGPLNKFVGYLSFVRNPARSLVIKDIKLFWRDPTQWSQFVIFFGIMAIYIANLRNTSSFREEEFWRSWIACLNVGALTLILATLTSRFVFPLISLEGRRFWILGLAPLSYKQLVWQKFWLSVTTSLTFTAGLAVLSGYMLQLEPVYWGLTVYSVIITNFGLSGLAVGLGTLYPTFTEDNPARIVSGMGGTLNLLLSVAYITLVVAAQVIVLQWEILDLFTTDTAFWYALSASVTFITALSTLCIFLPMRLGLRNLENMEF
jgi:ABC-2 type transport system permease protein